MRYQLRSQKAGEIAACGPGPIVCIDYITGKKTPIPAELHLAIQSLEGQELRRGR